MNGLDLVAPLEKLLLLEIYRLKARTNVDSAALTKDLGRKKLLPKDICDKLANDIIGWMTYRHKEILAGSDRHSGLGWSSAVIQGYALREMNTYIGQMMSAIKEFDL